MNENPYLDQIIKEFNELRDDWQEVFEGEFAISEVYDVIISLAQLSEAIFTEPKSGKDKHVLVRDAFMYLDKRYALIEKIDKAIPMWGPLELLDGAVIRAAVDLLISCVVTVLNKTWWAIPKEQ